MNKKGKSMISKKMGKNKVGLRSLLAKFMVLMMIVNILNVIHPAAVRAEDAEHLTNPDLTKVGGIKATNYNNGRFDVELLINGDGSTAIEEKNLDVVLVVDRSYDNMSRNRKMDAAKDEAARLVDYFLKFGNNKVRVGLVSFAGNRGGNPNPVLTDIQLTQNADALKNAIREYRAVGWSNSPVIRETFTQAGLIKANEVLGASNTNKKIIVLISGGEPTLSYGVAYDFNSKIRATSNTPRDGYEIWSENSWLSSSSPNKWKQGFDDSGDWTPYYIKLSKKLIDVPMGKGKEVKENTITEANNIKTKNNVEIFSVGIKADAAKKVLESIASPSRYYANNIPEAVVNEVVKNLKETKKVNSIENGALEVIASEQVNPELNNIELTAENKDTAATAEEKADLAKRVNEIIKNFVDGVLTLGNITLGKNEVLSIKYKAGLKENYKDGNSYPILEAATLYPKGINGYQKIKFDAPKVKDIVHETIVATKIWEGTPEDAAKFGLFRKADAAGTLEQVQNVNPNITKDSYSKWTIEFEGIKGKAVDYVVKELDGQGKPLNSGNIVSLKGKNYKITESRDGKTITNTELINLTVTKEWGSDVPDIAKQSVKFRITTDTKSDNVDRVYELNEANWTKKFENLPLYNNGEKINYSVVETEINGDKVDLTQNPVTDANGKTVYYHKAFKITLDGANNITESKNVKITNSIREAETSQEPENRIINVVKNWGNTPEKERKDVTVRLYELDSEIGELFPTPVEEKILSAGNDWKDKFVVPKKINGEEGIYYVFETAIGDTELDADTELTPELYDSGYKIGDYNVKIDDLTSEGSNETGNYGFYILNESSHVPEVPEETVTINVKKTWADSTPIEYRLPVTVRLFIENGEYLVPVSDVDDLKLDAGNGWAGQFEDLEKLYAADGTTEIKYHVAEIGVEGGQEKKENLSFDDLQKGYSIGRYNVVINEDSSYNVVITNDIKVVDITAVKNWIGSTPRQAVEFTLYSKQGSTFESTGKVIKLNGTDEETVATFKDMPALDNEGNPIVYYVFETKIGNTPAVFNAADEETSSYSISVNGGKYNVVVRDNGTVGDKVVIIDNSYTAESYGGLYGNDGDTTELSKSDSSSTVTVSDDKTPQGEADTNNETEADDEAVEEAEADDTDDDVLEVDDVDVPQGEASNNKAATEEPVEVEEDATPQGNAALPKTGGTNADIFGLIGLSLIGLGLAVKKRK